MTPSSDMRDKAFTAEAIFGSCSVGPIGQVATPPPPPPQPPDPFEVFPPFPDKIEIDPPFSPPED